MNINAILKLSVAERILLIEKLWDSLNTNELEISDAQKKELDKRLLRIKKGETKFYKWEDVKQRYKK
ncbi:MAG: addiction module protein [Bacteroidia bacterium]